MKKNIILKRRHKIGMVVLFFLCIVYSKWPSTNYTKTLSYDIHEQIEYDGQLRVATFNIKSLNHGNDFDQAVKEIIELDADILGVQEINKGAVRFKNMDMTKELAQQCGYAYSYFFPTMWQVDGYYGLALFSRYPIRNVSSMRLPNQLLSETRILAGADIIIHKQTFHVFVTHVGYKDQNIKQKQIEAVKTHVQDYENVILLGDFNSFRETDFFTIPGMIPMNTAEHNYITFRGFAHPDNIFYSDQMKLLNEGMQETAFSDHHALYLDLQLLKE